MTDAPSRVRAATVSDSPVLARIRVDSWRAAYTGIVPAPILERMDEASNAAKFSDRIASGTTETLVIEDATGAVLGYAVGGPSRDEDGAGLGEVHAIYLDPEARGRGHGRALLDAVMSRLGAAAFETAVLWVLTDNLPARRFYERAGFRVDGAARILDFDGTPIEEIRFRRRIAETLYHPAMTTDLPAAVPLEDHLRTFLDAPHVVSIGTTGEDGAPHQAIAWYRLDPDDRILLNSRSPRRWPADLQRDGRVSLAVLDGDDSMRWVGLTGIVETVIDDVARARDDICDLAVRYDDAAPERLAEFRTQARVSFRIRILRIHDHLDS